LFTFASSHGASRGRLPGCRALAAHLRKAARGFRNLSRQATRNLAIHQAIGGTLRMNAPPFHLGWNILVRHGITRSSLSIRGGGSDDIDHSRATGPWQALYANVAYDTPYFAAQSCRRKGRKEGGRGRKNELGQWTI